MKTLTEHLVDILDEANQEANCLQLAAQCKSMFYGKKIQMYDWNNQNFTPFTIKVYPENKVIFIISLACNPDKSEAIKTTKDFVKIMKKYPTFIPFLISAKKMDILNTILNTMEQSELTKSGVEMMDEHGCDIVAVMPTEENVEFKYPTIMTKYDRDEGVGLGEL